MTRLNDLVAKWQLWASTAEMVDDGWESDFPEWSSLIDAALDTMRLVSPDDLNARELVDAVWQLDQEDRDLADVVMADQSTFQKWVVALSESASSLVRWQCHVLLGTWGIEFDRLLDAARSDPDSYSRRMAIFAVAKIRVWEAAQFAEDSDDYVRQGVFQYMSEWMVGYMRRRATDPIARIRSKALDRLRELEGILKEAEKPAK